MPSPDDLHTAVESCRQLLEKDENTKWRAKWQVACERFWDALSEGAVAEGQDVEMFVELLADDERFSIARLVIPAFRCDDPDVAPDSEQQQRILKQIQAMRDEARRHESTDQSAFDSAQYVAEKRAKLDSELHRARILLHDSNAFGAQEGEEIRKWLEKHPQII